jgi:hypothetical protein
VPGIGPLDVPTLVLHGEQDSVPLPDVRRIVAVVILLALILSLLASVVTALG